MPMLPNLLPMLVSLLVCLDDPAPKPLPGLPEAVEMKVRVLDVDKKPVAGAVVQVSSVPRVGILPQKVVAGVDGIAAVSLMKNSTSITCFAFCDGFAMVSRRWDEDSFKKSIPTDFTFPLRRGIGIGGRVVDARGNPVAGVGIGVECIDLVQDLPDGIRYVDRLASGNGDLKTDENGVWSLEGVPAGVEKIGLKFVHPDFVSDEIPGGIQKAQRVTIAQLKRREALVRMDSGATVTGIVRDTAGQPIAGAAVVFHESPFMYLNKGVATDAQGRYRIPVLPAGKYPITVAAAGSCPVVREIVVTAGGYVEDFRLQPGNVLKVKVVDEDGKPVAAGFNIGSWNRTQVLYTGARPDLPSMGIPAKADAAGVYLWTGAPAERVFFGIRAAGMREQSFWLTAGPFEQTVVLKPIPKFSGKVTDAKTGKPVEKFRIRTIAEFSPRIATMMVSGESEIAFDGAGAFRIAIPNAGFDCRVLVEADGYRSQLSRPSLLKNGVRVIDFAMEAAAPVSGRLLGGDGKPLAGARVSLADRFQIYSFARAVESRGFVSDEAGRFRLPAQPDPFALVVEHDRGFLLRECQPLDADLGDLKLEPWAAVRGTLRRNGNPVGMHEVHLQPLGAIKSSARFLSLGRSVTTDEDGNYEFLRAVPGPSQLEVSPGPAGTSEVTDSARVAFLAVAGQKSVVDLGGGTRVSGRVWIAGGANLSPKARKIEVHLVRKTPDVVLPADSAIEPFDFSKEPFLAVLHATTHPNRRFSVEADADGAFWIPDVPAGDYWVAAEVSKLPFDRLTSLGTKVVSLTITATQAAGEKVAASDIEVPLLPTMEIGLALPAVVSKGIDGKAFSLADSKGKYVVLHTWAGWATRTRSDAATFCRFRADLPADKVTFVGLNLDGDPARARRQAKKHGFDWPHLDLGSAPSHADVWRIDTVGEMIVLDPEGQLALVSRDLDEVEAFLRGKTGK